MEPPFELNSSKPAAQSRENQNLGLNRAECRIRRSGRQSRILKNP
jgi:hypothetical protein